MNSERGEEFLIGRGAPFFDLQQRVGLVQPGALNSGYRALLCITLTAAIPLLLTTFLDGWRAGFEMATAPAFFTRFVIFIAVFFLMEGSTETRLNQLVDRFVQSGLVDDTQRGRFQLSIARALRLRNLAFAELICLVLAILLSAVALKMHLDGEGLDWAMTDTDVGRRLSVAGWWVATVSSIIFWFFVFRWFWRMVVWSLLLRSISRLDMRLVATHPDGAGGLSFIGTFPNVFAPLVFALSCVVAAAIFSQLHDRTMDLATYGQLMTAWLTIVLLAFFLPLLSFRPLLRRLKEITVKEADILATRMQRASERKVFDRNLIGPEDANPDEDNQIPDPSAFRKAANALSTILFSRKAIVPLSAAALVPLIIAGATLLPFKDLLKAAKGLLLL